MKLNIKLYFHLFVFVVIWFKYYCEKIRSKVLSKSSLHKRNTHVDLNIIGSYARLSNFAYLSQNDENLKKYYENEGGWEFYEKFSTTKYFVFRNAQAHVAFNREHFLILLSFKGTDSIWNILNNLDMSYTKKEEIKNKEFEVDGLEVHNGFFLYFQELVNKLDASVKKVFGILAKEYYEKGIKIVVTGHSLGGAAATLYAYHLKQNLVNILDFEETNYSVDVRLYTFGSPRVGNRKFSQEVNKIIGKEKIYTVQYKSDPVPKLPDYGEGQFVHVGKIFKCDNYKDPPCVITYEDDQSSILNIYDHLLENGYAFIGCKDNLIDKIKEKKLSLIGWGKKFGISK
jgi:predicted lipase